jgi:hypothetical protein
MTGATTPESIIEAFGGVFDVDPELRTKMRKPGLLPGRDGIWLDSIAVFTEHQHQGHASRALAILAGLCDRGGMTIRLRPQPLEHDLRCDNALDRDNLVAWYERHDFTDEGDGTMVHQPRKAGDGH